MEGNESAMWREAERGNGIIGITQGGLDDKGFASPGEGMAVSGWSWTHAGIGVYGEANIGGGYGVYGVAPIQETRNPVRPDFCRRPENNRWRLPCV